MERINGEKVHMKISKDGIRIAIGRENIRWMEMLKV